jgi:hypothetical protein
MQHNIGAAPKRWYKCAVAAVAELADAPDSKTFPGFRSGFDRLSPLGRAPTYASLSALSTHCK